MKKTRNTKIGDVFQLVQTDGQVRFFQYVANDLAQLNSDVIRVFEKRYSKDDAIDLSSVVRREIAYHTHCNTALGARMGYWEFVANQEVVGTPKPIFRICGDYGKPVHCSEDWWIWSLGSEMQHIGKLTAEYRGADIGIVVSPDCVVFRIEHDKEFFKYPNG